MIIKYSRNYEDSLIKAYIETFSASPWNEVWDYKWVQDRVRWIESVPNFIGIVSVQQQRVCGALLGYGKPYRDKSDFEIVEMYALPSFQGMGIGEIHKLNLESLVYCISV